MGKKMVKLSRSKVEFVLVVDHDFIRFLPFLTNDPFVNKVKYLKIYSSQLIST